MKVDFKEYKNIAIEGKFKSLEISKDINFISRSSRDIMLGNEYEKNFKEIKNRIEKIEDNFLFLESNFVFKLQNVDNIKLLEESKRHTVDFIYDVKSKMNFDIKKTDLKKLYSLYKNESTPLAIKSRDSFKKLMKKQEDDFIYYTQNFEACIKKQKQILFASGILFSFLIIVFVLYTYKKILLYLKTEEKLSNTKNILVQYKNAIDKTNIVSKTDLNGNIIYVNDEFCKVSQFTREELLKKPHNIIRHPNTPKEKFEHLWQTIRTKKSWQGVIENKKKDGSSYFVDTSIFPIIDDKGIIKEFIAIRKDITQFVELTNELSSSQEEILSRIGMIAETRSKETSNHVRRVAEYSKILALEYGMNQKEVELLYNASALHDIGKVATPDYILNKPGKLTQEEFEIMKRHASDGYHMLKDTNNNIIKVGAIIAHEHHEKYDGTGYPRGLKGNDIHIYARITALADVFDALGSKRSYKDAWDLNEISKFINSQSGKHFDPKLVEIFNERFDDFVFIRKKFKSEY